MKKLRVGVIFGGTNSEHEVSEISAKAIFSNLDREKFIPIAIKINKDNSWKIVSKFADNYQKATANKILSPLDSLASINSSLKEAKVDVVFPALHGPYGEDGTFQGMLELLRFPYVGCDHLSSSICMDKVIQKIICQSFNIPVTSYYSFSADEWEHDQSGVLDKLKNSFDNSYPLFVKPANQGSSVGVTKAHDSAGLRKGIESALQRDTKILVEQAVQNTRELECSILGSNQSPRASVVGEIIPVNEFYDYSAKYLETGSKEMIPAKIDEATSRKVQELAKKAFTILGCSGLSRIDFLLDDQTNELYLNEVNTLPGFTPISMYPKLWNKSGINFQSLLTELVEIGIERFTSKNSLNFS